jgi:hypothetical protein
MMRTMENLMEKMSMGNKPAAQEHHDPQPRNQNLRRGQVPQIRQREHRYQGDQQTRPPFQNNYVDENFDQMFEEQIHCCDDKNPHMFLTKREHDRYMSQNDDLMLETNDAWIGETDDALS